MADRTALKIVNGETIPVKYIDNTDGTWSEKVSSTGGGGGGGDASAANQTTLNTYTGALTETAPATDTASSGLNGRLQRIAQRLTSLIALFPSSLGQKTSAASFAVTVASDQSALSVTDTRLPSALGQATMANSLPVAIASNQGSLAVTEADGANTTIGALADAAITSSASGSLSGKLRGLVGWAYTRMPAALGQTTMSASLPVAVASDNVLTAGGTTASISPTVTVSTSPAYTAGDNVGGKLTITNAVRVSGGTGILQSILVIDKANQKAAFDILIFDSDPSAATITDNSAFAYSTDISKLIRRVSIAASDYVTTNSIAVAEISAIGKVVKASGSANLYAAIVTTGTPTYAATTDVIVRFGILQD